LPAAKASVSASMFGWDPTRAVLPNPKFTPGDALPGATTADVCTPGWATEHRHVTEEMRARVYAEYGLPYGGDEVDHLIPLELGGSNDFKNLWPQPYSCAQKALCGRTTITAWRGREGPAGKRASSPGVQRQDDAHRCAALHRLKLGRMLGEIHAARIWIEVMADGPRSLEVGTRSRRNSTWEDATQFVHITGIDPNLVGLPLGAILIMSLWCWWRIQHRLLPEFLPMQSTISCKEHLLPQPK
jgi:hypothetical protein